MKDKAVLGIIGTGAISGIYLDNLTAKYPFIQVRGISSAHFENAEAKARQYGIKAYTTEDLLQDPEIDAVVILTPVSAHYGLIRSALQHGKHVYTEKTIAETMAQAKELADIAATEGLYLCSAPDTFLGSSIQTAKKSLEDSVIGTVHSFSISITRDNDILTAMFPFLRLAGAGALRDYLVYYLTALVSLLGPVRKVSAFLKTPYPERMNSLPNTKGYGEKISTPNEALISAILELENGIIGTINEDNESVILDRTDFAVNGKQGILLLGNPNNFGDPVRLLKPDGYQPGTPEVLPMVNPYGENCRGLGTAEMVDAILKGRKSRTDKEMAMHVLDIIEAMETSAAQERVIHVRSTCAKPELFTGF